MSVVIAGAGIGGLALITAIEGSPRVGSVLIDHPGGTVLQVEPGSHAWQEGIRAGQRVITVESSDSPGGGSLTTAGPTSAIHVSAESAGQAVRATMPAAVLATALASVGVLAFARSARRAEAAASLAVVVGSITLTVASDTSVAVPARLLALALPTLWLVRHIPYSRWRVVIGATSCAVGVAWLLASVVAPSVYDPLEVARGDGANLGAAAVVGFQIDRQAFVARLRATGGVRTLDLAAAAVGLVFAAELELVVGAPPLVTIALGLLSLLVYPRFRGVAGGAIDRLLVADLRERLTIEASEAERGRLARDLHDVPLQELAGVIRRLDLVPGAHDENVALRKVADELRSISTELRPPILDDLGLVAAIEALAQKTDREVDDFRIRASVRDDHGSGTRRRPPADVEIALYRIVQEAVANALRHSAGHRVLIRGTVTADRVSLAVVDDGTGMAHDALERSLRAGHLGVPSMRQRAAGIGASVRFTRPAEGGLSVDVEWQR